MVIDVVNILRFLRSLTANNRREWLDENRIWYEEARTDFESLIQLLLNRISLIDSSYLSVTPKDSTFRIYRNLRFSKDKTPFKTHWGAYMNPYGESLTILDFIFTYLQSNLLWGEEVSHFPMNFCKRFENR